jgi:hypothetical protein
MLGGGTFVTQNKVLPGAYINFVSAANASSALSDRGIVTLPLILDWGVDGDVFEVSSNEFMPKAQEIFGYPHNADALSDLREIFKNARLGYFYKINGTGGVKATSAFGTAKYKGTGGNKLMVVVTQNEDGTTFDFTVLMDGVTVYEQRAVTAMSDLQTNAYIDWKSTAQISLTAGTPFTGGVTGTATGADYQAYIDKIEGYTFNTIGVATTDETINALVVTWTKRMRDEMGKKFQAVLYRTAADYEGIISVENKLVGELGDTTDSAKMVFWVTGAEAACPINASILNKVYDGEYNVDVDYTQRQLEDGIKTGKLMFHRVNDVIRVLTDVNTLTTVTDDKGDIFKENQTIRVIDQIANDIAVIFNTRYLGIVPNDAAGRISLWSDIVKHHGQLQDIRAIEDFSDSNVTVVQGDTKRAVVVNDLVTVVNSMQQLYMVVTIS